MSSATDVTETETENEHIVIPINAYETQSDDPPQSSDGEAEMKKKKGRISKIKGWFRGKKKSKSPSASGDESDLEAGKAIPSVEDSDNKPKKKGKWKRFKGWVSKKKKGAGKAMGFGKKKEDDGDKGPAFCCTGISLTARYLCFVLFQLLAIAFFVVATYMIGNDQTGETQLNLRSQYPAWYFIGCAFLILSVGFLAGLCRQLRVCMRYLRISAVLVMTAAILLNAILITPMVIRRKNLRYDAAAPTTPSNSEYHPTKWKEHIMGMPPWVFVMILQILHVISWLWYCITYMPCMRKCVHACCKKKKKKDRKKEEKAKDNQEEEKEQNDAN